jgi:choline monooxygenase
MDSAAYDPSAPLELAWTPPASWYRGGDWGVESAGTFRRHWLAVGRTDQVQERGSYFCGRVLDESFVVLRDARGELRALHNVCRHHAAPVATGEGRMTELVCPYHGWTYGLDGALRAAPGLGAAQGFVRGDFALPAIPVATFGPLVLIHLGPSREPPAADFSPLAAALEPAALEQLVWVGQRRYELACDWKVFVENYLDGGYHVPHLHPELAGRLDLGGYRTELSGPVVVQRCAGAEGSSPAPPEGGKRIGDGAVYAWLHPNLMLNRYGRVLDVNVVLPLGPERCEVRFDWWMEREASRDEAAVARCIAASEAVQLEDAAICEAVQRGLRSSSYTRGRLAPGFEAGMHLFHRLLAADRQ